MASVSLQKFNQITCSSPLWPGPNWPRSGEQLYKVLLIQIQTPFAILCFSHFTISAALEYFMSGSILSLNDIFYYGWILNNEICCQTLSAIFLTIKGIWRLLHHVSALSWFSSIVKTEQYLSHFDGCERLGVILTLGSGRRGRDIVAVRMP